MTTGSRRSKHLAGKAHATACHGCPHVRILYIHTLRSIPLSIHGNVYLFFEALVLIRWGRGCTKIRGNRSWSPSAPFFFSSPRFISSLTLSLSPFLPPPPPLLLLSLSCHDTLPASLFHGACATRVRVRVCIRAVHAERAKESAPKSGAKPVSR